MTSWHPLIILVFMATEAALTISFPLAYAFAGGDCPPYSFWCAFILGGGGCPLACGNAIQEMRLILPVIALLALLPATLGAFFARRLLRSRGPGALSLGRRGITLAVRSALLGAGYLVLLFPYIGVYAMILLVIFSASFASLLASMATALGRVLPQT